MRVGQKKASLKKQLCDVLDRLIKLGYVKYPNDKYAGASSHITDQACTSTTVFVADDHIETMLRGPADLNYYINLNQAGLNLCVRIVGNTLRFKLIGDQVAYYPGYVKAAHEYFKKEGILLES